MISIMMYGRRFFPYYTNTVITGLDTEGKGCVFAFDPVGSMTQQLYACEGSAMPLILPILDAHVSRSIAENNPMNIPYLDSRKKYE